MRCSYCGKMEQDVRGIVVGPAAGICDECTQVVMYAFGGMGVDILSDMTVDITKAKPLALESEGTDGQSDCDTDSGEAKTQKEDVPRVPHDGILSD